MLRASVSWVSDCSSNLLKVSIHCCAAAKGTKSSAWVPAFALSLVLAACQEDLHKNLSSRDANDITAVLASSGIVTKRIAEGNTYRITVDGSDFARATVILKETGYPREAFRSLAEVFPADGLIITPFEQRARMTFALGQELSRTISMIDGVTQARVHVVLPETDLRDRALAKSSASVVIHHRPGIDVADLSQKARLIVGNGAPGLAIRDVSISTFAAAPRATNGTTTGTLPASVGALPFRIDYMLMGLALILGVLGIGSLLSRRRNA
jgi:type III secretion protein J